MMNFTKPILICDENEEFRILVRDMLTKNGFFHIVEASKSEEALTILKKQTNHFVLINAHELNLALTEELSKQGNYLVMANNNSPETLTLSARLGVNSILSFPFHSKKLIDKINTLI